jgi:hypothetical protein
MFGGVKHWRRPICVFEVIQRGPEFLELHRAPVTAFNQNRRRVAKWLKRLAKVLRGIPDEGYVRTWAPYPSRSVLIIDSTRAEASASERSLRSGRRRLTPSRLGL